MSVRLIIVKSAEDPLDDAYLQAVQSKFSSAELQAVILSPHEFLPCSPDGGLATTEDLRNDNCIVIFTSKRAVQFYAAALGPNRPRRLCYAVGPATAEAATSIAGFVEVRGGAVCGNAEALCDLVENDLQSSASPRLLFPCGRVRKDTVESRLAKFGLTVMELYDAVEKQHLGVEIGQMTESLTASPKQAVILAFFSPSAATMVLSRLDTRCYDGLKLIAIGPTTTRRLLDLLPDCQPFECPAPTVTAFLETLTRCLQP